MYYFKSYSNIFLKSNKILIKYIQQGYSGLYKRWRLFCFGCFSHWNAINMGFVRFVELSCLSLSHVCINGFPSSLYSVLAMLLGVISTCASSFNRIYLFSVLRICIYMRL